MKLDELIRSSAAQNAFIGIEHLSEEEVEGFRSQCEAARAKAIDGFADRAVDKVNARAGRAAALASG